MGTIYYGAGTEPIHVDDRALAHLKIVIATKLRRNESFTLSWKHPEGEAPGRSTIWLHPSIPLRFVFDTPEPPTLIADWITAMANSANSSGGITMVTEDVLSEPEDSRTASCDAATEWVTVRSTPSVSERESR